MKQQGREPDALRLLRVHAEQTLKSVPASDENAQGDRMLRELRLHELELRMQNDELQQLCEQVHTLNERYVDLFMSAPVAYLALDAQSSVIGANLAAARLFGVDIGRMHGIKVSSFLEAEQTESFVRHMRAVLRFDTAHKGEFHLRLANGVRREVRFESSRDLRRPNEWRAALIDLTDVRRLERELERSRSLQAVGTFAAGVAHDFSNLLGLISTGVDLAVEVVNEPEAAKPPLVRIQRAVREGRRMVRQLLRFSSDQERAEAQVFAIDAAISAMEPELRRLAGKSVDLRFKLGAGDTMVQLDWGAPEEVVLNLTTNAINAMPHGGVLSVETSTFSDPQEPEADIPAQRWARLQVTDTGRGMDSETLTRAFEPFFTTKPGSSGTGLGLAMVHRIVTRAGGRVGLQSEPGKGTTVTIELPVFELPATSKHVM